MSGSGLLYANSTAITGTDGVWIPVADALICGFVAALCVRSADLASQSIRRGHTREPGEERERCETP